MKRYYIVAVVLILAAGALFLSGELQGNPGLETITRGTGIAGVLGDTATVIPTRMNPLLRPYSVNVAGGDVVITGNNWSASFQPYFYLSNGNLLDWSQIPANVQKNLWKKQISPTKWKYGVDFSGITDAQKALIQNVILHRADSQNLTFDDVRLEDSCIVVSASYPEVRLCHDDILRTYSIPIINKTDIVIGNLDNTWTHCKLEDNGYDCSINITEGNWQYDSISGTWSISFDPTITIDADDSVADADMSDVISEGNCTHLNVSDTAPFDTLLFYGNADCDKAYTKLTTHYDFTENDEDGTGQGNAEVNETSCRFGNCFQFDALDTSNITYGDVASLDFGTDNFSISFWIRSDFLGDKRMIMGKRAICGYSTFWNLWTGAAGGIVFEIDGSAIPAGGGDHYSAVGPTDITDKNWHHIVALRNGTEVAVYLDGIPEAHDTDTTITNLATNAAPFILGTNVCQQWDPSWSGQMDEVMIFGDDLSASQIMELYLNQSARFKETGTMTVRGVNITNETNYNQDMYNRLNLTFGFTNNHGSEISARLGQINLSVNNSLMYLYMPFEWGSGIDVSDYKVGSLEINSTWNATGGLNGTAAFNYGVAGDGLRMETHPFMSLRPNDNKTYIAWVKLDNTPSGYQHIFGNYFSIALQLFDDKILFVGRSTDGFKISPSLSWNLGQWYMISIVLNKTNTIIYRNDQLIEVETDSCTIGGINPQKFYIGNNEGGETFDGAIDNVMLFNRSLTIEEIGFLYGNMSNGNDQVYYTTYQNATAGVEMEFTIDQAADIIVPDFIFYAGNGSTSWYSPTMNGTIILESWNAATPGKPTSNSPADASYTVDQAATIGWILTDAVAGGFYNVTRNGTIQNASTAWTSGANLDIWVNTTLPTSGMQWNYTIFFNNSIGQTGIQDEVLITINAAAAECWTEYPATKRIIIPAGCRAVFNTRELVG